MKKAFEIFKKILLGGIIISGMVMIYLWITADKCYYAIKKHTKR